jgi:hypothetical protein
MIWTSEQDFVKKRTNFVQNKANVKAENYVNVFPSINKLERVRIVKLSAG